MVANSFCGIGFPGDGCCQPNDDCFQACDCLIQGLLCIYLRVIKFDTFCVIHLESMSRNGRQWLLCFDEKLCFSTRGRNAQSPSDTLCFPRSSLHFTLNTSRFTSFLRHFLRLVVPMVSHLTSVRCPARALSARGEGVSSGRRA